MILVSHFTTQVAMSSVEVYVARTTVGIMVYQVFINRALKYKRVADANSTVNRTKHEQYLKINKKYSAK